jgi:hypothetical protein
MTKITEHRIERAGLSEMSREAARVAVRERAATEYNAQRPNAEAHIRALVFILNLSGLAPLREISGQN